MLSGIVNVEYKDIYKDTVIDVRQIIRIYKSLDNKQL